MPLSPNATCTPAPAPADRACCAAPCLRVTIAIAADGRPNGMAFVEFDTVESAEAAMKKDKQIMGSRCAASNTTPQGGNTRGGRVAIPCVFGDLGCSHVAVARAEPAPVACEQAWPEVQPGSPLGARVCLLQRHCLSYVCPPPALLASATHLPSTLQQLSRRADPLLVGM